MLTFTRGAGSPSACIDVNGVVRDTCSVLRHLIEDRVDLRVELCPEPLPVRADPVQLGQVVMNLVVNARDAMPGGGVLTVRTARQDAPAGGAGRARLSVSDTGSGIPEDIRERIFEPFFTTKAGGSAAGLGLATVDRIVRQHDGQVALESRLGGGSTFTVRLPVFPGYVFARVTPGQRLTLLQTNLLVRVLEPENPRRMLRDLVMVRRALRTNPALESAKPLTAGRQVRIIGGPFQGVEGRVARLAGTLKVVLNVDMIGQAVSVTAEIDQVEVL